MKNFRYLLPFGLAALLLAQDVPASLNIVVTEGDGSSARVRQRLGHDPVVRVEDDEHHPVSGAVVVFALPVSGTSGEFANGSRTLAVTTDKDGVAAARGIRANAVPGQLQIYVSASYQALRARAIVNQTVEGAQGPSAPTPQFRDSSHSGGKWKWVVLGIVAAGGAGAAYYATHHSTTIAPVSISAGTVVFGSPR